MATFLFDSVIFGPVKSRRLGSSLGINLLPLDGKICSFDCIYCECGLNKERVSEIPVLPKAERIKNQLKAKLRSLKQANETPDVITFAGNGEPTLHPDFKAIITNTVQARNEYCPETKISVLSNSTKIWTDDVIEALKMVDMNILKLDSAIEETVRLINRPANRFSIIECIEQLGVFNGELIIQTLFCKGEVRGIPFDNTTPEELEAWITAILKIKPKQVMIYSISRDTPIDTIVKVEMGELERIGAMLSAHGVDVLIS